MSTKIRPAKPELIELYTNQRMSTHTIAANYDVSHMSVKRWLRFYEIERRATGRGLLNRGVVEPTADDLYRMVHFEHKGYREIAALFGVDMTAVPYWLKKHNIPLPKIWETRRKGSGPTMPTEAELRNLYEQGLSLDAIGGLHHVSSGPIKRLCKLYGIPLRPDGWDGGKRFICQDGHQVRSTYEQRVDDWLSQQGIAHEYEPVLLFDRRYHADFLTNGWYIEIWGVNGSRTYAERKTRKRNLYHIHNTPLIELSLDSFSQRRKDSWQRRLARCLTSTCPQAVAVQLEMPIFLPPQQG